MPVTWIPETPAAGAAPSAPPPAPPPADDTTQAAQGGPVAGAGEPAGARWIDETGQESAPTPPTTSGWGNVWGSVGAGLRGTGEALYGALANDEGARSAAARSMFEQEMYQRMAGEGGIPQSVSDIHGLGDVLKYAGGQALEAAPQLGLYGAGALGGPAGLALAYGADVALRTGGSLAAEDASNTQEDVGTAALFAMPTAALDIGGSGAIVKGGLAKAVAEGVGGGMLRRTAAGALTEAGELGAIGGAQTATSTLGEGRTPTAEEVMAGAAGNAAFGFIGGAFHGLRAKAPQVIPDGTQASFDLATDQGAQMAALHGPLLAHNQAAEVMQQARDKAAGIRTSRGMQGPLLPNEQASDLMASALERGARERAAAAPTPEEQAADVLQAATQRGAEQRAGAAYMAGGQAAADAQRAAAAAAAEPQPKGRLFGDQAAIEALQGIPPPGPGAGGPPGGVPELPRAAPPPGPPMSPGGIQLPPEVGGGPRPPPPAPPPPPPPAGPIVQPGARPGIDLNALPPRARAIVERQQQQEAAAAAATTPPTLQLPVGGGARSPAQQAAMEAARRGEPPPPTTPGTPPPAAPPAGPAAPAAPEQKPWQDVARDAWKQHAGNMRGFAQVMNKVLTAARTAEAAAEMIRAKAEAAGDTSFARLDAMHQALTGKTIEEATVEKQGAGAPEAPEAPRAPEAPGAPTVPEAGGEHAIEARKEPAGGKPEYPRNGEGGPPAEAGGGGGARERAPLGEGVEARAEAGAEAPVAAGEPMIWRNQDTDVPVTVRQIYPEPGPDGRRYAEVEFNGNRTGVPLDDLRAPAAGAAPAAPARPAARPARGPGGRVAAEGEVLPYPERTHARELGGGGRRNQAAAKAATAGNFGGVLDALARSKDALVARIADLAQRFRDSHRVAVDADFEGETHEVRSPIQRRDDEGAHVAAQTITGKLRALRAMRDALQGVDPQDRAAVKAAQATPIRLDDITHPEVLRDLERRRNPDGSYPANEAYRGLSSMMTDKNFWDAEKQPHVPLAELERHVQDHWQGEDNLAGYARGYHLVTREPVAGRYEPATRTIRLKPYAANSEHTIGHELVHALTHDAIDHPTPEQRPVVARLQKLYEFVRNKLELNDRVLQERGTRAEAAGGFRADDIPREWYGLKNLHEFVAEAHSDPYFQRYLRQIPYENTSAWRRFTQHIGDLMGIRREQGNALTELINLHEELHGEAAHEPAEAGTPAGTPAAAEPVAAPVTERPIRQAPQGEVAAARAGEGVAPALDPIRQWKALGRESAPGLDELVEQTADQLGRRNETPEQRAERIATLSHVANLESGPVAKKAREYLEDMTTLAERRTAREETQRVAAQRINADLGGPLTREKPGAVAAEAATPHDRAVFDDAKEGMPLTDALQHIAETHPEPEIRDLAQHLADRGVEGTVRQATPEERAAAPADTLGEQKGDAVILHSPAEAAQTTLHEAVHKATRDALDAGGKAALEMRRLYAEAQKVQGLARQYGLKSVHEFVAEAFSNPEFRAALAKVGGAGGSLWQRFRSAVARMLGFGRDGSLLDRVMRTGGELMDEQHRLVVEHGDGSPRTMRAQAETGTATGAAHAMADAVASLYRQAGADAPSPFERAKAGLGNVLKDVIKDKGTWLNIASMPSHMIAKTYSHILPALKGLHAAMDARAERRGALQARSIEVLQRMEAARRAAGSLHLQRFDQVMSDIQAAGGHPRELGTPAELDARLKAAQQAYNTASRADPASTATAAAKDEVRAAQAAVNARAGWEKMTPKEREAVDASFAALKSMQDDRYKAMKAMLGSDAEFFSFKGNEPWYAPLKRYGDWVVSMKSKDYLDTEAALRDARERGDATAQADLTQKLKYMTRDADHRVVTAFDNQRQAEAYRQQLRAKLPDGTQVHQFARSEMHQKSTAHRDALVEDVLGRIDREFGSNPQMDAIKDMIRDAYIERLPDGSRATIAAHRELVSGWSPDFSRAITDRLNRDAFQIATMEHARTIASQLQRLDEQRRNDGGVKANDIYNTMAGRVAHESSAAWYQKPERAITEAAHIMYQGASPAFMLMNMLQTPMIAVPVIGGKFGYWRTWGAVHQAVKDTWKLFSPSIGMDLSKAGHLEDGVKSMLQQLQNRQLLDMTAAHMSARMARGERIVDPQNPGQYLLQKAQHGKELLQVPVQYIETVNRTSTAVAAYRLFMEGKAPGRPSEFATSEAKHAAGVAYAADVLRDSHVDYSQENNATIFRKPGMRVLLQFQKYGLSMFHMVSRTMADAYGRPRDVAALKAELAGPVTDARRAEITASLADLQERKGEARKALTGLLAMHQLLTGAFGLPFTGAGFAAADVMRNWFGPDEQQADTKADFQNYLADALGTDVATAITRGLPAALLGADISKRVGMGDLVPGTGLLDAYNRAHATKAGMSGLFSNEAKSLTGPAGSLTANFAKGIDQMSAGNYIEGVQEMMPHALANALKAYREANQGAMVGGKPVTAPLNNSDAFYTFMGLVPTRVEEATDVAYAGKALASRLQFVRGNLIAQYADAQKSGEPVPQAVQDFNTRNPDQRITAGDAFKKIQADARSAAGGKPARGRAAALQQRVAEEGRYATE